MDVLPWPNGHGFSGADVWWDYLLSRSERQRLENLMGLALLDRKLCESLLARRDDSLLAAFGLSQETRDWLKSIKANSLAELAQAMMAASDRAASVPALCQEAA